MDDRHKRRGIMALAGGLGALGALWGVESFLVEPNRLELTHHRLPVPDLPDALEGFTIAHLTDLHFGRERGAHARALDSIEAQQPDLVVCTGDFVERADELPVLESFLDRVVELAPEVVAVLGNWEYKQSDDFTERAIAAYAKRDLHLLRNETLLLDNGIAIIGADDPVSGHFDPDHLFDDLPDGAFRLFLVHSPIAFDGDYPDEAVFDLGLAGHTHGGQFRLGPFAPVTPAGSGRFVSGFYDTDVGPAYVSRGIGMTLIRGRFLCLPEMPYFTLTSSDRARDGERR